MQRTAPDAFKDILDETVLKALNNDYTVSMSFMRALGDAFCAEGAFSWAESGKMTGALAIGVMASLYVVNTSSNAAIILQNAFKQQTGLDVSYGDIFIRLCQVANTSSSAGLGIFCALRLIENYLGHQTDAEKFLKHQDESCSDKSKDISRKVFNLLCAIAANVPIYFLTQSVSIPMAACTAVANVAISWLGVSSLPLTPSRIHPARHAELAYLNEQLATFLMLSKNMQQSIMADISVLQVQSMDDQAYKRIYARILNLAAYDEAIVQTKQHIPGAQKAFAIALGLFVTTSQAAFVEQTYVGISRLFEDSGSTPAIATGSTAALFALLPNVGFGFTTGYQAANAMTSNHIPLAKEYLSKTREALKAAIAVLSLFASGTLFTLAMKADTDLTNLANATGTLKSCLDVVFGTISYTAGNVITAHYMLKLCDEILIYFAQRCADPEIRRLFTFVMSTMRMHRALAEATDEHYLEILRWKMTGKSALSDLLHHIFSNRMQPEQYKKTKADVNKRHIIMRDQFALTDYQSSDSFIEDRPYDELQSYGLRRRHCMLFTCDETKRQVDMTPQIQPAHSITL